MTLAFILFKYFPFGGLQRDFLRIALACLARGHQIRVYTMGWQGDQPAEFDVRLIRNKALSAHKRDQAFQQAAMADIKENPVDLVVGFNKMPGLDVYYAADPCYEEKAQNSRGWLYRQGARYKHFNHFESAVFSAQSHTHILMIAERQIAIYQQYYQTPQNRFHLLPPGIAKDRKRPANADSIRAALRQEFGLADQDKLLLMVGSGFKTKGLDRALLALQALPAEQRQTTKLFVIGQDNFKPFERMANKLGVSNQVRFFAGRDDISRFLLGADLLIHPAYHENTGTVLLEAVVAGLPVLVTDVCGYARYIQQAEAGLLVTSPFNQQQFNQMLLEMLLSDKHSEWQANGLSFAEQADIYSMPERAAEQIEQLAGQLS
ncbi:glycosyltransferase family 4 protein [Spartinivicinus poritis]|uniref:Glycosyltransferase family 4 protein n=1 Tax=Spartinivicinus poritis TaxID=2994640 RepID=A0ABT5U8R9_9GAMM|nr:glycosyltransferase family 4 protein [Spartinivicinus sp. A2-2]MDE1461937.1 glycosyltransferase family 4 protein [Spartinivicinus sp. A2-2]